MICKLSINNKKMKYNNDNLFTFKFKTDENDL